MCNSANNEGAEVRPATRLWNECRLLSIKMEDTDMLTTACGSIEGQMVTGTLKIYVSDLLLCLPSVVSRAVKARPGRKGNEGRMDRKEPKRRRGRERERRMRWKAKSMMLRCHHLMGLIGHRRISE